jgi:PQQ-dependent dehydrogenase (s-GDH family)
VRALLVLWLLAGCARPVFVHREAAGPHFAMRVIREGLSSPWEVFVGPDGWLWISERTGLRITRVEPSSGAREVLLTFEDAVAHGQNGVLGAAFSEGTLFVAYSYRVGPEAYRSKIVSYPYDGRGFGAPHELIRGLSADGDHASGRLQIGPDGRVYYAIGDQGKNQYAAMCKPSRSQALPTADEVARHDWASYEGKVLRLARDGSIPFDNPVLAGVRSHVFSYGHRNVQGLVFDDAGRLYASEHGPKTDDEINALRAGKNYGWPHVAGFRDDRAYEYANWSAAPDCAQLAYHDYAIPAQVPRQRESAWDHPDFTPPLRTFYTVESSFDFASPDCVERGPFCWPTIAPSSIEFYPRSRALLVTSLKFGSVFMLRLDAEGTPRSEPASELFQSEDRYRDLAVGLDGRTIYVVTDDDGYTSGPTAHASKRLAHRGALLEFKPVD